MDMQLLNLISQCRDIHFIGPGMLAERVCYHTDFICQQFVIVRFKVKQLAFSISSRHQYEPLESGIIHQQDTAKRQVAYKECIGVKYGVEDEAIRRHA